MRVRVFEQEYRLCCVHSAFSTHATNSMLKSSQKIQDSKHLHSEHQVHRAITWVLRVQQGVLQRRHVVFWVVEVATVRIFESIRILPYRARSRMTCHVCVEMKRIDTLQMSIPV